MMPIPTECDCPECAGELFAQLLFGFVPKLSLAFRSSNTLVDAIGFESGDKRPDLGIAYGEPALLHDFDSHTNLDAFKSIVDRVRRPWPAARVSEEGTARALEHAPACNRQSFIVQIDHANYIGLRLG